MVEKLRRTSLLDQDSVKLELRIEVDDVAETVGRLAQKGANPFATAANQQPDMGQTDRRWRNLGKNHETVGHSGPPRYVC